MPPLHNTTFPFKSFCFHCFLNTQQASGFPFSHIFPRKAFFAGNPRKTQRERYGEEARHSLLFLLLFSFSSSSFHPLEQGLACSRRRRRRQQQTHCSTSLSGQGRRITQPACRAQTQSQSVCGSLWRKKWRIRLCKSLLCCGACQKQEDTFS